MVMVVQRVDRIILLPTNNPQATTVFFLHIFQEAEDIFNEDAFSIFFSDFAIDTPFFKKLLCQVMVMSDTTATAPTATATTGIAKTAKPTATLRLRLVAGQDLDSQVLMQKQKQFDPFAVTVPEMHANF